MLHTLLVYAYPAIAFFALIEGPLVAVTCGVAVALGYVNPFAAYGIILGGAIVQDLIYYGVGFWAAGSPKAREIATRTKLLRENLLTIESQWRQGMLKTLLLSKFAYGIYAPFIVTAGSSHAPFWRFLGLSTALSVPVIALWMSLGFGMTKLYGASGRYADYVVTGVGLAGLAILVAVMRRAHSHLNPKQAARKSHLIEASDVPTDAR